MEIAGCFGLILVRPCGGFCWDVLLEVSKGTIIGQDSLSFLCCKYRAKTIFQTSRRESLDVYN